MQKHLFLKCLKFKPKVTRHLTHCHLYPSENTLAKRDKISYRNFHPEELSSQRNVWNSNVVQWPAKFHVDTHKITSIKLWNLIVRIDSQGNKRRSEFIFVLNTTSLGHIFAGKCDVVKVDSNRLSWIESSWIFIRKNSRVDISIARKRDAMNQKIFLFNKFVLRFFTSPKNLFRWLMMESGREMKM